MASKIVSCTLLIDEEIAVQKELLSLNFVLNILNMKDFSPKNFWGNWNKYAMIMDMFTFMLLELLNWNRIIQ